MDDINILKSKNETCSVIGCQLGCSWEWQNGWSSRKHKKKLPPTIPTTTYLVGWKPLVGGQKCDICLMSWFPYWQFWLDFSCRNLSHGLIHFKNKVLLFLWCCSVECNSCFENTAALKGVYKCSICVEGWVYLWVFLCMFPSCSTWVCSNLFFCFCLECSKTQVFSLVLDDVLFLPNYVVDTTYLSV